jgi:hypothetical protein
LLHHNLKKTIAESGNQKAEFLLLCEEKVADGGTWNFKVQSYLLPTDDGKGGDSENCKEWKIGDRRNMLRETRGKNGKK